MTAARWGKRVRAGVISALFAAHVHVSDAAAAEWKPQKNVEVLVGVSAGGALDVTARLVQQIWQSQRLVAVPTIVVNRPGGGGTIAWNTLTARQGDGHVISFATPTLLSNHITGTSKLGPGDYTPLALLASDYIAFVVPVSSPVRTGRDLIARLKDTSSPFSIGNAAQLGNSNHIALAKVAKSGGVDPRNLTVVVYKSGGESMSALLGGHIDMAVTASYNAAAQAKAGKLRIVAVSAPNRLPGAMADVPTWRESGVDVVHAFWRGVIGPKGLSPDQIAYWDQVLAKTAASGEWKDIVAKNLWDDSYRAHKEFSAFVAQDYRELQRTLLELDLIK